MKINHLHALGIIATIGLMLTGCRADVDLQNVDTTSEVSMGLQLPIGSFNAKLGDFLKLDSIPELYFDSMDNKGVLTFKKQIDYIRKEYHHVDLSEHISKGKRTLKIKEKLPADMQALITTFGYIKAYTSPIEFELEFPMVLDLNGINTETSDERLDSAQIETAKFVSKIGQEHLGELQWAWLESIRMDLGKCIYRKLGQRDTVTIYDKQTSSTKNYGEDMPISVDNFTLCLMDDPNGSASINNVVNQCEFTVFIKIVIPQGDSVHVDDLSAFIYDMEVQFIDYKAIWGMYSPSNQMRDVDSINIGHVWDSVPMFANAKLPFEKPVISLDVYTKLAGAIRLKGDYLYTQDREGEKHYAMFNGKREFELGFEKGEYLDPYKSAIGDSCKLHITFDNTSANGEINRLFEKTPYKLGYMFGFSFDTLKTPQIRMLPSSSIGLEGEIKLPMIFGEGVHLQHTDTLRDISLSQFSIDSLLGANSNVKVDLKETTNVDLIVNIGNSLPFDVKAVLRFLDEEKNVINDSSTKLPMNLTGSDTIRIKAPIYTKDASGKWNAAPNPDNLITASLTKAKLDQFPHAKYILYTLIMDDESLKTAFDQGNFNIKVEKDAGITFKMALTAQLDAVLRFETQNNGQK